jgi:predicted MPP superfamily phosphohydrolase
VKTTLLVLLAGMSFTLLVDLLFYRATRPLFRSRRARGIYWLVAILFLSGIACYHLSMPRLKGPGGYFWAGKGIMLLLLYYVPRVAYLVTRALFLLKRRGWIERVAASVALLSFLVILDGVTLGRYRYEVTRVTVTIPGLPPAFDGLRVVQLSDLHLGSLGRGYPGIRRMVEEVNALHPDVVVITGDVVNNFAGEILPWSDELGRISATLGKFAVTGNHDHGDYTRWDSPTGKENNTREFYRNMEACGFRVLENEGVPLALANDTIFLCGVENWRKPPRRSYGNLQQALRGTDGRVVVLLSHDPVHWREEVIHHPVALTLSGHTHAMQVGFRVGKYSWTPARYFFPEYNGLYERDGKQLYVSRGVGYLGIPGRIGRGPEITLLQLVN